MPGFTAAQKVSDKRCVLGHLRRVSWVGKWEGVEKWLRFAARHHYPNSTFANKELGDAWVEVPDNVVPFPFDEKLIEE